MSRLSKQSVPIMRTPVAPEQSSVNPELHTRAKLNLHTVVKAKTTQRPTIAKAKVKKPKLVVVPKETGTPVYTKMVNDPKINPRIKVSFGLRANDASPKATELSWIQLCERFESPDLKRGKLSSNEYHTLDKNDPGQKKLRSEEKDGEYFCAAVFGGSGRRNADNVEELSCFVMDFDSGRTTGAVIEERLAGLVYFAYTSFSHRPGDERWRVLVPYALPIKSEEHQKIFDHFQVLFEKDLDNACKTASQLWYTPACPPDAGASFQVIRGAGKFLKPSTIAKTTTTKAVSEGTASKPQLVDFHTLDPSANRLNDALRFIKADERATWIKIGLALHHDMGAAGQELWMAWSRTSQKFDEEDAVKTWDSFSERTEGTVVTLGTVFKLAKDAGWNDATIPQFVADLNKEYFVAFDGGAMAIFHETTDPQFRHHTLNVMTVADFKLRFANRVLPSANGDDPPRQIAPSWLKHPLRREYSGIVFSPGGEVESHYNLWRGFAVPAKHGSWQLMHAHIRNVVCAGDEVAFTYLLNWMARCVQQPGAQGEVAVVIKGGRGAGKGTVARAFGKIFGKHFQHISNPKHLTGSFNGHLRDCVVLFVDEAFWAGDKAGEGVLKQLISEPSITIEQKHREARLAPNRLHIFMASNNAWVVPAGIDERRYLVLQADDSKAGQHDYFECLNGELESGGYSAMLADLLVRDISAFNVRAVPKTDALQVQKMLSLDPVQNWWVDKLKAGELVQFQEEWGKVEKGLLHDDYVLALNKSGQRARQTQTELGMRLGDLLPAGYPKACRATAVQGAAAVRQKQQRTPMYEFPSLEICRKHFQSITGLDERMWD